MTGMTRSELILRHLAGPGRDPVTIGMLAAGTNFSRSYCCYLLNGKRQGSIAAMTAVAGFLGCSLDTLLDTIRNPPKSKPLSKRKHGA